MAAEHEVLINNCFPYYEEMDATFHPLTQGILLRFRSIKFVITVYIISYTDGSFPVDLALHTLGDVAQYLLKNKVVEALEVPVKATLTSVDNDVVPSLPANQAEPVIEYPAAIDAPVEVPITVETSFTSVQGFVAPPLPVYQDEPATEYPAQILDFCIGHKIGHEPVIPYMPCPSEFWIHLYPPLVTAMEFKVTSTTKRPDFTTSFPNLFPVEVGRPCLAFDVGLKLWSRAIVLILKDEQTARVQYVDYGNSSDVNLVNIRVLSRELAAQPPLAIKCCLEGLTPTNTTEIDNRLASIMFGMIEVEFVGRHGEDAILVHIIDSEGRNVSEGLEAVPFVATEEVAAPSQPIESSRTLAENVILQPVLPAMEAFSSHITSTLEATDTGLSVKSEPIAIEAEVPPIEAIPIEIVAGHQIQAESLEQSIGNLIDLCDGDDEIVMIPVETCTAEPVEVVDCTSSPEGNPESTHTLRDSDLEAATVWEMTEVTVSHYNSPSEFWIQLKDDAPLLSHITERFKTEMESSGQIRKPIVGILCATNHKDYKTTWFRAQIMSAEEHGFVDVSCIDYGFTQSQVRLEDLRILPYDLNEMKPLAVKCCLTASNHREWSQKEIEDFEQALQDMETTSYQVVFGEFKVG